MNNPKPAQPDYLTRTSIRELLDRHGLTASRALGQNFLCDPSMIDKIVRLAGVGEGDRVIEVGPGLGALTVGLVRAKTTLTVVELDQYLVPALREVIGDAAVDIKVADAMTFDFSTVYGEKDWALVANLPYNISSPLLLDLLSTQPLMHRALVLVQAEVGERLAAGPGSKIYGIPSVLTSYWGSARVVGSVPPQLFHPQPRVDSVLVRIDRWETPPISSDFRTVRRLVRAGFGQRRKMLRRSLSAVLSIEQIEAAGVDPTARAETLGLDAWGRLADQLSNQG